MGVYSTYRYVLRKRANVDKHVIDKLVDKETHKDDGLNKI